MGRNRHMVIQGDEQVSERPVEIPYFATVAKDGSGFTVITEPRKIEGREVHAYLAQWVGATKRSLRARVMQV